MAHLARARHPVPVADRRSAQPAALRAERQARGARRRGCPARRSPRRRAAHCAEVGAVLADMHVAGAIVRRRAREPARAAVVARGGARGAAVPRRVAERACSRPSSSSSPASAAPTCRAARCTPTSSATTCCSTGARIGGVIDFCFAGVDAWLFDVAVTLNDWCVEADGTLDRPRARRVPRRLPRGARRSPPPSAARGR